VKQAGLAFAATMIPNLFQFVYHFAMTRQLGVERYGALSSLISLLIIVSIPAAILSTIVAKYSSEFHALNDRGHLRGLTERVLLFGACFAVIAGLGAAIAGRFVARYLHITEYSAVFLVGIMFAISLLLPALRAILQGVQDFVPFAISGTIEAVGKAGLGILFVYLGFGLTGAVAGMLAASLLSLVYTGTAVFRQTATESVAFNFDARRLALSMAGIALATVCTVLLGFIDQPMVKHFFPAFEAGLYGSASLAGKLVLYALGFVPLVLLPKAAGRAMRGESQRALLLTAMGAEMLIAIPLLAFLAVFPETVLRILGGGAYLAAAPLLLPYGAAMTLLASTSALVAFNVGAHRFAFVAPLFAVTLGEVLGIQFFHQSITQVLTVVIAANALGFGIVFGLSLRERAAPVRLQVADAA
jgi:O-antigen/teichoic acid export membrane protein